VATDRHPESLADLAGRYGGQVLLLALDVTDAAAAEAVVAQGLATFGRIDVVVSNAGYATTVTARRCWVTRPRWPRSC
jgi:NADP-dependent 3-hydroxy acid dehydrogenase YdfG